MSPERCPCRPCRPCWSGQSMIGRVQVIRPSGQQRQKLESTQQVGRIVCPGCLADCKACPSRSLQSTSQVPPGSNGTDLGLAETCSQCFLRSGAQRRVCGVAFFQAALCCLAGADPAWQNEVDRGSSPKEATAKVLGK